MAIQDVNDVAGELTKDGQPADATSHDATERNNADAVRDTGEASGDTNTEQRTEVGNGDVDGGSKPTEETTEDGTAPLETKFSPDALRQITNLSATNRQLKQKLKEFEAKLQAIPAESETQKELTRLKALEADYQAVLKSPRKYLEHAKKTLEDVAADALAAGNEVSDPRIDAVIETLNTVKAKLDEQDTSKQTEAQKTHTANVEASRQAGIKHVKDTITSETGQERWVYLQDKPDAATNAFDAALKVYQRDWKDEKTGELKPISKEDSQRVFEACLDEAEALELAKEVIADRKKNGGQPTRQPVQKKGIELREEGEQGAERRQPPKPTIDASRGPTTSLRVQRGPTDVRTARARALAIATGKTGK